MDYETARSVADTYGLVFLMAVFIGAIIYIFRRGATKKYERAAWIATNAPEHPEDDDPGRDGETRGDGTPGRTPPESRTDER